MNKENRYSNAYSIAKGIIEYGGFLKGMGILLGLVICGASLFAIKIHIGLIIIGIIAGFSIGSVLYNIGVMIAANGEMLYASLDTAENTSAIKNILLGKNNVKTEPSKKEKIPPQEMKKNGKSPQEIYEEGYCPNCGHEREQNGGRCAKCSTNFFEYAKMEYEKK